MHSSLRYELENARQHAGISITEWDAMPGSHIWLQPGQSTCKADVLVAYRLTRQIDAVQSELARRDIERKNRQRM